MRGPPEPGLTQQVGLRCARAGALPLASLGLVRVRVSRSRTGRRRPIYCLSSSRGEDANGKWQDFTCTCLTEQGTAYEITQAECRTLARQGPVYNPYKQQRREDAGRHSESPAAPAAHVESGSTGAVVGYRPGSRGDLFPRNPGYETGETYTGPVAGL